MTRIASYQTLETTNYPPDAPVVPWTITDRYVASNYDPGSSYYRTFSWRIYEGHSAPLLTAFLTPLKVTASPDSKTYDGLAYAGSDHYNLGPIGPNEDTFWHPASGVSGGVVAGLLDSVGVDAGSDALTIQNVNGKGLYSSQNGGANVLGYDLYGNDATLTINPANVTVTANNQNKIYGDTFTFSGTEFTASGLVGGQTIGRADIASAGAPAPAVAGNYPITIANAGGGSFNPANYSITYRPGSMKVLGESPPPPPALPQPQLTSPYQWLAFANGVAVDPERPLSKVEYEPAGSRDAVQWVESYLADTGLVDPSMLSGIVEYKPLEVEISFDEYWAQRGDSSR